MNPERRQHPRFSLQGVSATLILCYPPQESQIDGEILDLSYSGIKLQLNQPIFEDLGGRNIRILLKLPDSGIPLTISGVVKRHVSPLECGLHYQDVDQKWLDEFIFECTKHPAKPLVPA